MSQNRDIPIQSSISFSPETFIALHIPEQGLATGGNETEATKLTADKKCFMRIAGENVKAAETDTENTSNSHPGGTSLVKGSLGYFEESS